MSFSGIYRRPVNLNDRINEKGPHASGVGALYKSMAQSMRALGGDGAGDFLAGLVEIR